MTKQQDPEFDPLVRGMDLRIQIHTKMSWIRNTGINGALCYRILCEELMRAGHTEHLLSLLSQVNGRMIQIKK